MKNRTICLRCSNVSLRSEILAFLNRHALEPRVIESDPGSEMPHAIFSDQPGEIKAQLDRIRHRVFVTHGTAIPTPIGALRLDARDLPTNLNHIFTYISSPLLGN